MKASTHKKIRVLLVDDHTIVREGIRSCLSIYPSLEIAGEACDGQEALNKAKELKADVILMDINMPRVSGFEATERMRREMPNAKVLILSVHNDPEYVHKIIRCGARGYILKDASPQELAHAIESVDAGQNFFTPEVSGGLLEFCRHSSQETGGEILSEREEEVLKLVAQGASTKDIAAELKIAFRTAETHRERIMRKLNIHNVAGLTRYAILKGLVELS